MNDYVYPSGDQPRTNSLLIAERFGKAHKNVLQAIDNVECSEDFARLNFQPSSYITQQGKPQRMFELTRDGFMFLVMGFTGAEASRTKEAFVGAFNALEAEIKSITSGLSTKTLPPPKYPATGSPFDNVQASKLGKLQRTNKSMALAYLVECGVTPEYVQSVLSRHGALPHLAAPSTSPDQMPAPIEHLAREVPLNYDRQDDLHWYLLRETFTRICGDYDVTATGRMLAARGLLSRGQDSLTKRLNAKPWGFGEHGKISFFAIRKRLAQFAATPASPDRPQPDQDGRDGR